MSCVSPSEGGLNDGHISIDLGAVPEELNIGGIDGHGVDQSTNPNAITC